MIKEIDKKEIGNLIDNCLNSTEKKKIGDMVENNNFSGFWELISTSKNKKVIKWRENRLGRIIKEHLKKWEYKHEEKEMNETK